MKASWNWLVRFFLSLGSATGYVQDQCCHLQGDGAPIIKTQLRFWVLCSWDPGSLTVHDLSRPGWQRRQPRWWVPPWASYCPPTSSAADWTSASGCPASPPRCPSAGQPRCCQETGTRNENPQLRWFKIFIKLVWVEATPALKKIKVEPPCEAFSKDTLREEAQHFLPLKATLHCCATIATMFKLVQ